MSDLASVWNRILRRAMHAIVLIVGATPCVALQVRTLVVLLVALIVAFVPLNVCFATTLNTIEKRIENNKLDQADLNKITDVLKQEPGNARAHYLLGRYLERSGFEQLSRDELDKALALDPNYFDAHHQRCLLLFRMHDVEPAMKEAAIYESMLGDDGEKLFELGYLLENNGKKADAQRLYEKASHAKKKGLGVGLSLARIRFSQSRFNEALNALEWDLRIDPKNPAALNQKAKILFWIKRDEEAIACISAAYEKSPCYEAAARTAYVQFLKRQRWKEALRAGLFDLFCVTGVESLEQAKKSCLDMMKKIGPDESERVVNEVGALFEKKVECRYFRFAAGDLFDRFREPYRAIRQYKAGIEGCSHCRVNDRILARGTFRLARDTEIYLRDYKEALLLYEKAARLDLEDVEMQNGFHRLRSRLSNRNNDVAWHLKDWLFKQFFNPSSSNQPVPPN